MGSAWVALVILVATVLSRSIHLADESGAAAAAPAPKEGALDAVRSDRASEVAHPPPLSCARPPGRGARRRSGS